MSRNSEIIVWSNTFACNIKIIDDQHRHLVDLVNKMFNHVTGDEDEERLYLKNVLQEAVRYIKIHFATEEKIMLATRFAGYIEHKEAHQNFVYNVANNIKSLISGKRLTLLSFSKFLKNWILTHIAVMDKQYFDYIRRIATRKADGKLTVSPVDLLIRHI